MSSYRLSNNVDGVFTCARPIMFFSDDLICVRYVRCVTHIMPIGRFSGDTSASPSENVHDMIFQTYRNQQRTWDWRLFLLCGKK